MNAFLLGDRPQTELPGWSIVSNSRSLSGCPAAELSACDQPTIVADAEIVQAAMDSLGAHYFDEANRSASDLQSMSLVVVPRSQLEQHVWQTLPPQIAIRLWKTPEHGVYRVPNSHSLPTSGTLLDALHSAVLEAVDQHENLDVTIVESPALPSFVDAELSLLTPRNVFPANDVLRAAVNQFNPTATLGAGPDGEAVHAGLYLWHDDLHASHEYSQSVQGAGRNVAGDYWHGIMHRREPDYSNSKYWYRRVGNHPIFPVLLEKAAEIVAYCPDNLSDEFKALVNKETWDPFGFIDVCENLEHAQETPAGICARAIQQWEMLLLMKQTVVDARR